MISPLAAWIDRSFVDRCDTSWWNKVATALFSLYSDYRWFRFPCTVWRAAGGLYAVSGSFAIWSERMEERLFCAGLELLR